MFAQDPDCFAFAGVRGAQILDEINKFERYQRVCLQEAGGAQSLRDNEADRGGGRAAVKWQLNPPRRPECYLAGVLQTALPLETLKSGQAFMCGIK